MSGHKTVAVLGGGAWGTALALTALRAGHEARIWARDAAVVAAINKDRQNPRYLTGIILDEGLWATATLDEALRDTHCVLSAVPAQSTRDLLKMVQPLMPHDVPFVLCAKGIERGTGRLLSDIAGEILPDAPVAALSGPSFAADVARRLPTAVTVASQVQQHASGIAALLSTPLFRCYSSGDLVGVELGGALKNVLAIAAGAVAGAKLGASAQAAMVTRGFVELRRIGAAFGAAPETLMGLSGLGDLMLTCSSGQSRNFAYGVALASGQPLGGLPLAEGAATAAVAAEIVKDRSIEAPLIIAVDRILRGELSIDGALAELMARPLRSESD